MIKQNSYLNIVLTHSKINLMCIKCPMPRFYVSDFGRLLKRYSCQKICFIDTRAGLDTDVYIHFKLTPRRLQHNITIWCSDRLTIYTESFLWIQYSHLKIFTYETTNNYLIFVYINFGDSSVKLEYFWSCNMSPQSTH